MNETRSVTAVRKATADDLWQLRSLGARFLAASAYGDLLRPDVEAIDDGLRSLIERGVLLVAERDGLILGMLGGVLAPVWFAQDTAVATELCWWVDEAYRGGRAGVMLVQAFEEWAKEHNASFVAMSELTPMTEPVAVEDAIGVCRVLRRLGYQPVERSHVREV